MKLFLNVCTCGMLIISIILSTIWVIIEIKDKRAVKSKFILPCILFEMWFCVAIMEIIQQKTSGIISASLNCVIWFTQFLFNFFTYRDEKKTEEKIKEQEELANINKEDVIYADFVEKN